MVLFRKIPPVPFLRAGGFLFLFVLGGLAHLAQAADLPLPPNAVLHQVAVWKHYRVRLLSSPPTAEVNAPVEIFIEAKREEMASPFPGSIHLGVERLAPDRGELQETELGPADQQEAGLWRVTQVFQASGVYAIRTTLTDPEGEIFVLQGKITISPVATVGRTKYFLISLSVALLAAAFIFAKFRARRRF